MCDGVSVGGAVGFSVGLRVGTCVGSSVGVKVGEYVGASVGVGVGGDVGTAVGARVVGAGVVGTAGSADIFWRLQLSSYRLQLSATS